MLLTLSIVDRGQAISIIGQKRCGNRSVINVKPRTPESTSNFHPQNEPPEKMELSEQRLPEFDTGDLTGKGQPETKIDLSL